MESICTVEIDLIILHTEIYTRTFETTTAASVI